MGLHKTQDLADRGRICFRGDTRLPDEIFRNGFATQDRPKQADHVSLPDAGHAAIPIRKRHVEVYKSAGMIVLRRDEALQKHGKDFKSTNGWVKRMELVTDQGVSELAHYKPDRNPYVALLPRTPDVHQYTAVCMTPRFSMAVLFPPKQGHPVSDPAEVTWVYAVYARNALNTHGQQCAIGLQALQNEFTARDMLRLADETPKTGGAAMDRFAANGAFWPLYAQEVSTCRVDSQDVICALPARRVWKGADWTHGCDYTLTKTSLRLNVQCTVVESVRDAVYAFLDNEPAVGETPSIASGFYKDSADRRTSVDTAFRSASDSRPFVRPTTRLDI